MRGEFGFPGAQAEGKQFLQSGNRPENREIFRFPQAFLAHQKSGIFDESVKKSFFDAQSGARGSACGCYSQ